MTGGVWGDITRAVHLYRARHPHDGRRHTAALPWARVSGTCRTMKDQFWVGNKRGILQCKSKLFLLCTVYCILCNQQLCGREEILIKYIWCFQRMFKVYVLKANLWLLDDKSLVFSDWCRIVMKSAPTLSSNKDSQGHTRTLTRSHLLSCVLEISGPRSWPLVWCSSSTGPGPPYWTPDFRW